LVAADRQLHDPAPTHGVGHVVIGNALSLTRKPGVGDKAVALPAAERAGSLGAGVEVDRFGPGVSQIELHTLREALPHHPLHAVIVAPTDRAPGRKRRVLAVE